MNIPYQPKRARSCTNAAAEGNVIDKDLSFRIHLQMSTRFLLDRNMFVRVDDTDLCSRRN